MRILVAEDEKRLAEALRYILEREGYQVDVVHDGKDALDYVQACPLYDLFILDIMMPKMSGLDLLAKLRKDACDTPALFLTALSETGDKVVGLDTGADDYMTKPFQSEELLARVRALTRRKGEVILEHMVFGDLSLDLGTHVLACESESAHDDVRLSETEFDVLLMLMRNEGRVISKEQLLSKVWGYDSYVEDNNVEAYISFIRKKLKYLHSDVVIETIRGVGYLIKRAEG